MIKNVLKVIIANKPISIGIAAIIIGGAVGTGVYFTSQSTTNKGSKAVTSTSTVNKASSTPSQKIVSTTENNGKIESVTIKTAADNQIDIKPLSAIYYAKDSVNIRKLNNTNSEIIKQLSYNQAIQVTGQTVDGTWYQVNWNGDTGYVKAEYLTETQKVEQQTSSTNQSSTGSSSSSTSSGSSNTSTSPSNPSPEVQTQPAQQQVTYTEGVDWNLTEQIRNIKVYPNRVYNGIQNSNFTELCKQVATGQSSVDSVNSQLNSLTWQESASSYGAPDSNIYTLHLYNVIVNRTYIDSSHANDSANSLRTLIPSISGGCGDIIVYRNSDGSFYVGSISASITG